jgi:hypothetical protein
MGAVILGSVIVLAVRLYFRLRKRGFRIPP